MLVVPNKTTKKTIISVLHLFAFRNVNHLPTRNISSTVLFIKRHIKSSINHCPCLIVEVNIILLLYKVLINYSISHGILELPTGGWRSLNEDFFHESSDRSNACLHNQSANSGHCNGSYSWKHKKVLCIAMPARKFWFNVLTLRFKKISSPPNPKLSRTSSAFSRLDDL